MARNHNGGSGRSDRLIIGLVVLAGAAAVILYLKG